MVRDTCETLLDLTGLEGYAKTFRGRGYDEDLQGDWRRLLPKFNDYQDISSSDHEGLMEFHNEREARSKEAREKAIALHQLKAYSEHVAKVGTPADVAFHNGFLVSVCFCFDYIFSANISLSL